MVAPSQDGGSELQGSRDRIEQTNEVWYGKRATPYKKSETSSKLKGTLSETVVIIAQTLQLGAGETSTPGLLGAGTRSREYDISRDLVCIHSSSSSERVVHLHILG